MKTKYKYLHRQQQIKKLFQSSELVYILPCEFNTQVSVQYWRQDKSLWHKCWKRKTGIWNHINFTRPPWEDIFWDYHRCDHPYVIIHRYCFLIQNSHSKCVLCRNGCGPERKFCDQALEKGGLLNWASSPPWGREGGLNNEHVWTPGRCICLL